MPAVLSPRSVDMGMGFEDRDMIENSFTKTSGSSVGGGDDRDELLRLLEQKDSDLRAAAQLGKMLLDEKEEDAEAHEGEKEALWRRIQEMARRVMELEQEASELRKIADRRQDHPSAVDPAALPAHASDEGATAANANGNGTSGGGLPHRTVVRDGIAGRGAEERALRAKNEMLERQLLHLKEVAAETQLELQAARKARFTRLHHFRDPHSVRSSGTPIRGKSRANSIVSHHTLSPPRGRVPAEGPGAVSGTRPATALALSNSPSPFSPKSSQRREKPAHKKRSSSGRGLEAWFVSPNPNAASSDEDGGNRGGAGASDGGDGRSPAEEGSDGDDGVRTIDRSAELPQRANSWGELADSSDEGEGKGKISRAGTGGVEGDDEHGTYLMEQNAWLLEQLEAKDELIEALRSQVEELELSGGGRRSSVPGVLSFGGGGWGRRGGGGEMGVLGRGLGIGLELDGSDDDSDDDEDDLRRTGRASFGRADERSFLDELMDGGRGQEDDEAFMSGGRRYGSGRTRRAVPLETMRKVQELGEVEVERGGRERKRVKGPGIDERHLGKHLGDVAPLTDPSGKEGTSSTEATGAGSLPAVGSLRSDAVVNQTPQRAPVQGKSPENMPGSTAPPMAAVIGGSRSRSSEENATEPCSPDEQSLSPPYTTNTNTNTTSAKTATFSIGAAAMAAAVAAEAATPSGTMLHAEEMKHLHDDDNGCVQLTAPDASAPQRPDDSSSGTAVVTSEAAAVAASSDRRTGFSDLPSCVSARGTEKADFGAGIVTPTRPPSAAAVVAAAASEKNAGESSAEYATEGRSEGQDGSAGESEGEGENQDDISVPHTPNRAERKSRQAMNKLGLRAVPGGVYRMEMKMSHGVVFAVKNPDVFKHPRQNTYVVFGVAETEMDSGNTSRAGNRRGSIGGVSRNTKAADRRRSSEVAAITTASPKKQATTRPVSRPDPMAVETKSVGAGLDPADVLTIVSHTGCTADEAIAALKENDGDVVNAVLALT